MQTSVPGLQLADSVASGLFPNLIGGHMGQVLATLLIALVLVLVRRAILTIIDRRVEDRTLRYKWSKGTAYASFLVGLLLVLQVWLRAIQSVGTFLGLVSAGLAIALKDLVADLAGWIFILWRHPFELGDRIQIGEHAGDVVDIRIFAITLMEIGNWVAADQSTGRMIHVPNAMVFTQPLANYTAGFPFLWNEIPVLVTFESDWRKAKTLIQEIVNELAAHTSEEAERHLRHTAKRFLIHYTKLTPVVYTSVEDSGVLLTARYLTAPRQRRGTTQAVWERILEAFQGVDDVDLAYPTQRLYVNPLEGKPGARAPWPPLSPGTDAS
ncbi:MAG: mechanosensitive ion channel family protein [Gemmatimonadetes bacterium]|nr:mechanosensitive ion channel family protein [Gemmatimonadota bacterium]